MTRRKIILFHLLLYGCGFPYSRSPNDFLYPRPCLKWNSLAAEDKILFVSCSQSTPNTYFKFLLPHETTYEQFCWCKLTASDIFSPAHSASSLSVAGTLPNISVTVAYNLASCVSSKNSSHFFGGGTFPWFASGEYASSIPHPAFDAYDSTLTVCVYGIYTLHQMFLWSALQPSSFVSVAGSPPRTASRRTRRVCSSRAPSRTRETWRWPAPTPTWTRRVARAPSPTPPELAASWYARAREAGAGGGATALNFGNLPVNYLTKRSKKKQQNILLFWTVLAPCSTCFPLCVSMLLKYSQM